MPDSRTGSRAFPHAVVPAVPAVRVVPVVLVVLAGATLAGCMVVEPQPQGANLARAAAGTEGCDTAGAGGGSPYSCGWRLQADEGTFLAVELIATGTTRFHIENTHQATWSEASAYFHFRILGESDIGEGITSHLVFTGAENACSGAAPWGECTRQDFSEHREGSFGVTLEAGRYLLLYAFFGAADAELELDVHTDRAIAAGRVQKGSTSLLSVAGEGFTTDGEFVGKRVVHNDAPAWLTVRHAGQATLDEVSINAAGKDRTFTAYAHYPAWVPPAEWGEDFLIDNPNLAVPAGTSEVRVSWHQSIAAPQGFPVVGVLHAPFFVDAEGCLDRYGPGHEAGRGVCGAD